MTDIYSNIPSQPTGSSNTPPPPTPNPAPQSAEQPAAAPIPDQQTDQTPQAQADAVQTPSQSSVPRIHTYADDVKAALATNQMSVAKIAMAEQKRRDVQEKTQEVSSGNPKNIALLVASIALIIMSAGVVWYFMYGSKPEQTTIIQTEGKSFIKIDNKISLNITNFTRSSIVSAITQARSQAFSPQTITALEFSSNGVITETRTWLAATDSSTPDELLRALKPEFLFGVYADSFGPSSFFLFETESFEQAFAGMLSWEKTLANDAEGFIYKAPALEQALQNTPSATPALVTATGTTATSSALATQQQTSTSTATTSTQMATTSPIDDVSAFGSTEAATYIPAGSFVDQVIANRNARAFVTTEGTRLFFYAVIDKVVFMGESEATLQAVMGRYLQQNITR